MRVRFKNLFKILLISTSLVLSSCVESPSAKRKGGSSQDEILGDGSGSGRGATAEDGSIADGAVDLTTGRAELRHIVDPFDGTYKTKVTVPKNFTGFLYLSGLNITSLSDRIVKVRFNFGREMEPIVVPATVGRAPGITPQTDIEVLILDMNSRPFENVRLLYDLYDYNKYDTDEDGSEDDTEFTQDPRDGGLFCRGLKIEHDPSFAGSTSNSLCDAANEKCNYAYAKVVDSGLIDNSSGNAIAFNPSEPQLDVAGNGYTTDSTSNALMKCLPDSANETSVEGVLNSLFTGLGYGSTTVIGTTTYTYNGPYRTIAESDWEISGDAVTSLVSAANPTGTGLFQSVLNAGVFDSGVRSFLFPRAGQMSLNANVDYFGSANHFDTDRGASAVSLLSSGDSQWMDGCNIRVTNYDEFTNEGISSCNVTATIELITPDLVNGGDIVLFPQEGDESASSQVKLQLIRPSLTDFQGREVLYSSMKTCSNSNSCGSQECCFNNRCWSKDLVSQCLEDVPGEGNLGIGENCASDYQCSSLCCNAATGSCGVHVNTNEQQVLCSKSPGQACVAKEWCRQENVPNCLNVKTGTTPTGQVTCALRCYNIPTFGDCINGTCQPPTIPDPAPFDPSDPNNCANAVDPPQI